MEQKDILDILFEGRNKEYGAYLLRKNYNKRLTISLSCTIGVIVLLFAINFVFGNSGNKVIKPMIVEDVTLDAYKEKPLEPPPPPPPKPIEQKFETKKFTPPKIVKDEEVQKDEKPPEQEQLDSVKIDFRDMKGDKDDGSNGPPVSVSDAGKGVVEAPKKDETNYDETFTKVEVESTFPGGPAAWLRFMNKNLHYPDNAVNNEIQGTIVVQFIVDKEGVVSDVEAISGPEEGGLREEAVRVIKKSGKWVPAIQNGRNVKSYKKQPIVFKLETQ